MRPMNSSALPKALSCFLRCAGFLGRSFVALSKMLVTTGASASRQFRFGRPSHLKGRRGGKNTRNLPLATTSTHQPQISKALKGTDKEKNTSTKPCLGGFFGARMTYLN